LALNFRLAVNMLQLIYALKKHNNWRFPTRDICNYNFYRDRAISAIPQITMMKIDLESILWDVLIAFCNALDWHSISNFKKQKYRNKIRRKSFRMKN
jgi:hypothetical protein